MPAVSFLTSNYKTPPAFLRRALDSMLAQTFTDFEIVAVNDGVRDASYAVLLEYAARDARIRLIENEVNLGLAASLNKGLGECAGKYAVRMDTDDICYPDRLEKQVAFMEAHPDIMFAGAWADVFGNDENAPENKWTPSMCPPEEYRIRLLFASAPLLIHPTVIFRTDFLKKNGLRYSEDPRYRYSEDYEMWTRCADCGAPGILEQTVLKYRNAQEEDRVTVRHAREMQLCVQNVQKKLLERLGIEPTEDELLLNSFLLNGRKPYNIRYKKWMERILRQNRSKKIYNVKIIKKLLRERWYGIVYYGAANESDPRRRLKRLASLYPSQYLRFVINILRKRIGKNDERTT